MDTERRILLAIATAQGKGIVNKGNLVEVAWLHQFFNKRTVQTVCWQNCYGHDDDHGSSDYGFGYLWLSGELKMRNREEFECVIADAAGFTSIDDVIEITGIEIPEEWDAVWGSDHANAEACRANPRFQQWFAANWPAVELTAPKASSPTGRTATVVATSEWVRLTSYTPEQAMAERMRIEASNLPTRSKAAFKAHVARRTSA